MKCLNCDTPFEGARHCPECGQRSATTRLRWRDILGDIHHQLLEGNLPWPRTLWRMTFNSGEVAREFVGGKRVHYVHPLKYAFYLVLIATLLAPSGGGFGWSPDQLASVPMWRQFLLNNIPVFMLLVSPVAVVVLRSLFWKPYNLIEIWVFVLYLLGQLALLFLLVTAIDVTVISHIRSATANEIGMAIFAISSMLVLLVYYSWGIRQFFRARLDWSLIGSLASLAVTLWVAGQLFILLAER